MNNAPKKLHIAKNPEMLGGRFNGTAHCGRLVNRMSLLHPTESDRVTCERCAINALISSSQEIAR